MSTTKIVKEVSMDEFREVVRRYKDSIVVSQHALDHLKDAQRKIFKESDLIRILTKENTRGIGLQENGRYAAFYRRKTGFIRMIVEIKHPKLEIITFTNPDSMPNLKGL